MLPKVQDHRITTSSKQAIISTFCSKGSAFNKKENRRLPRTFLIRSQSSSKKLSSSLVYGAVLDLIRAQWANLAVFKHKFRHFALVPIKPRNSFWKLSTNCQNSVNKVIKVAFDEHWGWFTSFGKVVIWIVGIYVDNKTGLRLVSLRLGHLYLFFENH